MAAPVKIALTGAAGLVGQNLIPRLKARGYTDIVALDKHKANTAILRQLHPDITVIEADLARDRGWQQAVADADVVVLSHAQIGGLDEADFTANNVTATQRVIEAVRAKQPYVVHLSSSVVESAADDWYVQSKDAQEKIVVQSALPVVVLRPTLMFGWFDRKHLGWLARFMQKTPVFPIPGNGRYLRQPLYAGDFCDIIMACIERRAVRHLQHFRPGDDRLPRPDPRREGGDRRARAASCAFLILCSGRCCGPTACSTATRPSPPGSLRRW